VYQLSQEEKDNYYNEGYILLKNVINVKYINELMDFVAHVIRLEAQGVEGVNELSKKEVLNDLLIKIKRSNPSSSSWIYQTILGSYKLKKFFVEINIATLVQDLLNIDNGNNLGIVSPAFRFDIPGDKRNVRTWHQDGNYFLENKNGDKHVVAWIPMSTSTKENGSVIIAPTSHKRGKQSSLHEKPDGFSSEQYTASEDQYKSYEHVYVEAEPGDLALIHMDLLHSSGVNVTDNEVRYTAQIRMNTINDDNYRPVFLKPQYLEYERSFNKS
jgi:ectoine hydroxylase-related dioxygenase (phytanoyl-CoA dioxygenase family)